MKTNAIIRIICYSIVFLALLGILLGGMGQGLFQFHIGGSSGEPITGEVRVDADNIQNLEIEWVSGSIDIQIATDGSTDIRIYESGSQNDTRKATWQVKGKTLVIQYSQPGIRFGFTSTPDKDLTILFPADWKCGDLDIESVSASIQVSLLAASQIEVENVSGACIFTGCRAKTVSISTVSGNVKYAGEVDTLDCETVSADCEILPDNNPLELNLESVSGDLIVGLFEDTGFTIRLDSLSGHIYSDFGTSSYGGDQTYGDGSCLIEADTVSGNIEIKKMELRFATE